MPEVYQGGPDLTRMQGMRVVGLTVLLGLGIVWSGLAGQGYTTSIYEGEIRSIKVDKCGLQPGLCEGSIILAQRGGQETPLNIRVGTWMKRGDRLLTIDELQVGERVKVQTFRLPGEANPRAAIVEFTQGD
jgi:hypothetical protein